MVTIDFKNSISPRQVQYTLFSILISVGVFSYLLREITWSEVVDVIRNIDSDWLVLFFLFSFSMNIFRTWRYKLLLLPSRYNVGFIPLFLISLVRNFFSDLLPARLGTLIYIYLVRSRLNIPYGPAISSFSYSFIFDIISLAILILIAVTVTNFDGYSLNIIFVSGLGLGGIFVFILKALPSIVRLASKICCNVTIIPEKWRNGLRKILHDTENNLIQTKKSGMYWKVLALSFGVRCCKYLSLYALLVGLVLPLGYSLLDFPLAKVFLGLCSAELASSLPISGIAGFGAYEGTWAMVFQILGYPERLSLLSGISHHLFTQMYGYSLGLFALIVLLLPIIKYECSSANTSNMDVKKRSFWIPYVGTVCCVCALVFFLFPKEHNSNVISMSTGKPDKHLGVEIHKKNISIDTLQGKVVYERSGGIYVTDIGTKKEVKITGYGNRPRWSPDGRSVAFAKDTSIMLYDLKSGKVIEVAKAPEARAACFTPDGKAIIFTDGRYVRKVDLRSLKVSVFLEGEKFREIDISKSGKTIAVTVKTLSGFKVQIYNYPDPEALTIARGCSASLSPDGQLVTVNGSDHKKLFLYDTQKRQKSRVINVPSGKIFDNQMWSNHSDWIVSTSYNGGKDIFVHHSQTGSYRQVTFSNDSDRGDLYIAQ